MVQFAVVHPADRDCVFVTDLAAERARLGEANMMRFRRHSTADHARLRSDELAALLVAQANGLRGNTMTALANCSGQYDRGRGGVVYRGKERLPDERSRLPCCCRLRVFFKSNLREFDRCEPFTEASFDCNRGGRHRVQSFAFPPPNVWQSATRT
jgi:hypothetical protein